jgi:hypothetical protein
MTVKQSVGLPCCLILACLSAGGCVSPGKIDSSLIARYQDSIRGRSPQPRKGTHGPDLLKPVDGAALVELSITTDPKTKLRMIDLALEQAIRLALLNSLDIRIVSFQPAISREEMVKAAAEFDYVVFGDLSHIRTDQRSVSGFASSKSRVIPGEVGIRTRSVIGTQLELKYALTRTTDNSTFTMPQPQYESMLSLQLTQPLLRFGGLVGASGPHGFSGQLPGTG